MGKIGKTLALLLLVFFLISIATTQPVTVKAQPTTNSAPSIAWQQEYGDYYTEALSNLIQTVDGGYAFIDTGWSHGFTLAPSVLYKTDSYGNVEWQKRFNNFTAIAFFQTSDEGFQISGNWNTYGTTYEKTPTLIKCDFTGNIQWVQNYTSEPPYLNVPPPIVFTRDNTSISLQLQNNPIGNRPSASITQTDSEGNIQWQLNATFAYSGFKTPPVYLTSLIETSDGSIAALGVGTPFSRPMYQGNIYLVKTIPFLPQPSPSGLPTPIPTPLTIDNLTFTLIIAIIVVIVILSISLLLYVRHRKTVLVKKL